MSFELAGNFGRQGVARDGEAAADVAKPKINTAELIATRNRAEIDEQMKFAVSKLESAIKYADPKVFIDDTIKPRANWLSRLHR
jgi:hypothetical protein